MPYPRLGDLVDEIGSISNTLWREANRDPTSNRSKQILEIIAKNPEKKIHNAGSASNYGDDKNFVLLRMNQILNILNTHVFQVEKESDRIVTVLGKILFQERNSIQGKLFADCYR